MSSKEGAGGTLIAGVVLGFFLGVGIGSWQASERDRAEIQKQQSITASLRAENEPLRQQLRDAQKKANDDFARIANLEFQLRSEAKDRQPEHSHVSSPAEKPVHPIASEHAESQTRSLAPPPEDPPLNGVRYPIWIFSPLRFCADSRALDVDETDTPPPVAQQDWSELTYNEIGRIFVSDVRIGRWMRHSWSRECRDRTAAAMLRRMGRGKGWHEGELRAISEGLIWVGMKRDQLLLVAGSPHHHTTRRTATRNEEVWHYRATNGRLYGGYIVLDHNTVENWELK
ncbi:MAG: hypothetical protein KF768_08390 [Phycisphaeraceae bacterium]|nr:hypothetical protein [Phycisphaeraceae bacterium]